MVVCGEAYEVAPMFGAESGVYSLVKQLEIFLCKSVFPDMVQQGHEAQILLTVDFSEFDCHIRDLCQCTASEKIWGVIIGAQQCLVLRGDNRSQLLQVAYHEQLHPAEREV